MPDLSLEEAAWAAGHAIVCGVDEAGRGPWAGPVVAAAVILPDKAGRKNWPAFDDSKKLSAVERETMAAWITQHADVGVGVADVDEIEILNILGATHAAMSRAVVSLKTAPSMALVDGNRPPILACAVSCAVKGDGRSLSIAAASIVAKATRDRMMRELDAQFPGYGWAKNAGYGTPEHIAALARLGVTPAHRRSFAPIRKILSRPSP